MLGKRKRRSVQKVEVDENTEALAMEDAQAIFRRHFEAQFAPLEEKLESGAGRKKTSHAEASSDDQEDGDGVEDMRSDSESEGDNEWGGLSGEDDSDGKLCSTPTSAGSSQADGNGLVDSESDDDEQSASEMKTDGVEVVDYSKPTTASTTALQTAMMSKREMRAYLSSRPPDPTSATTSSQLSKSNGQAADDDPSNEDSKALLANDLALQRLISESHILATSNPFHAVGSGADASDKTFVEGRTRKLTTDLRLQKLGSKESIFTQRKMPMGMRKGIHTAKLDREEKRRREARENGIILETAQKKNKRIQGRGGVAVDMPGMGKFRNGELRLSNREVKAVEMEGKRFDSGKKRRRRR